jgi:DNA invertase Pin-like site-specific DNA recombinase
MADAAAGKFDVVLVYHSSRFARDAALARSYKKLLRDHGIQFISVTQPLGDDPTTPTGFLAEGINELFDEYHSVVQSFWTSAGLREKKQQGELVGSIPWGLEKDGAGEISHDPQRAPLVREMFERYATGTWSDRELATWLNSKGAKTTKGRSFSKDTVREMMVNAAYAGYVTGRREKSREITGNYEPIVDWALFERVQEIRALRTRTLHPGRPSAGYALSGILCCERCGSRMHGSVGGRNRARRYVCSRRKQDGSCDAPIVPAAELEEGLANYLRAFDPPQQVRLAVLRRLREATQRGDERQAETRRRELLAQLARVKDLYVMGDLTKEEYSQRKRVLERDLPALEPQSVIDLGEAAAALTNFGLFWDKEREAAERNKLLRHILEKVTQDSGELVSVTPRGAFLPYFQFGAEVGWERRERRDSNPRPPA